MRRKRWIQRRSKQLQGHRCSHLQRQSRARKQNPKRTNYAAQNTPQYEYYPERLGGLCFSSRAFQVGRGYPHQRKCPVWDQRDDVDYTPSSQVILELG